MFKRENERDERERERKSEILSSFSHKFSLKYSPSVAPQCSHFGEHCHSGSLHSHNFVSYCGNLIKIYKK
jgi:hypothetical protein